MPQNRDFTEDETRSLNNVAKVLYTRGKYTSQQAFGEALGGLHQTSVSLLMRGKLGLRRSTADRIAALAGTTVEAILGRTESRDADPPALAAAIDVLASQGRTPMPGVVAAARVRARQDGAPSTAGGWAAWIAEVTPILAPFFSREWAPATLSAAAEFEHTSATFPDENGPATSTTLRSARPTPPRRGK